MWRPALSFDNRSLTVAAPKRTLQSRARKQAVREAEHIDHGLDLL